LQGWNFSRQEDSSKYKRLVYSPIREVPVE
jgi:hypothetical protein